MHGARTPVAKAAAKRRIEEQKLAEKVAKVAVYGTPIDVDPHQALLDEVHRAAGVVAWLALQVSDLGTDEVTWGKTEEIEREGGGENVAAHEVKHGAQINVWIDLFGKERDRLAKVSKMAIDAGVSERLVRLEESKGEMIAHLIKELIEDAEAALSPVQQDRLRVAAADKLRALPVASQVKEE